MSPKIKTSGNPSSVIDVLNDLQIEITSAVAGREITARCPFHDDAHPSFSINRTNGLWICYQCGERGNLEILVEKVTGGLKTESYLREVRYTSGKERRSRRRHAPVENEEPEQSPAHLVAEYESFRRPPANACRNRGFEPRHADDFGVKWRKGWILPIWDPWPVGEWSDLWGWQYKRAHFVRNHPVGVRKSETLFGFNRIKPGGTVALVESPLDAVRLSVVDVPAVASFGAMVSEAQQMLLIECADHLLLAMDNDSEGRKANRNLYRWANRYIAVTVVRYPEGVKDPGDMSNRQVERVFRL